MVGVSAVSGRHQAGKQGEAARATGWRSDVGVVESHASGGKKIHAGRTHVLRSVNGGIQTAQIIGYEDDQVGLFNSSQASGGQKERE